MGSNRNRPATAVGNPPERDMDESERDDEREDDRDEERGDDRGPRGGAPAPAPTRAGGSPFAIYKAGQGTYVRWGSAAGAALIAVAGIFFLNDQLSRFALTQQTLLTVQTISSVVLLVVAGVVIFWLVGRKRNFVDFLVATEGEMKKVNWSTRREVIGATKVVIVTVLALSFILFVVDLFFIFFFSAIGVLKVDILKGLFGGGG
jgi:preprotein translocase SecE subunit